MAHVKPTRGSTTIAPIQRTTLTQAAFESLIQQVVKGHWKPGDQIPPERELCQQFGIARTSLREALKAMELIGMLDSRVGEGTFVCPRSEFLSRPLLWAFTGTDHEELREIIEARVVLEETLAGLAAERATDHEIATIGSFVHEMQEDLRHHRLILDSDFAFHQAVGDAAHNLVLSNSAQLLRNMMRQWIYLKLLLPDVPASVLEQHTAIFKMMQKRDPQAARAAMRVHVTDSSELVIQVVEQRSHGR